VREVDKSCDMFQKNLKEEEGDKTKTKTKTKMGKARYASGRGGAERAWRLACVAVEETQDKVTRFVLCYVS
jgi:hypothetical protein